MHATPGPELDFRLAVLAERLEAEVPIARAAVAPTLEGLGRFAASPQYRQWFERGTRSLGDGFLNWAMREAQRPELAGADALVSLELWARTQFLRARQTGAETLDAVFPVDLTEALHATRALKRHLGGRGVFTGEGWDGLLQCARRAEKTAWPVKLSLDGARVVITPR